MEITGYLKFAKGSWIFKDIAINSIYFSIFNILFSSVELVRCTRNFCTNTLFSLNSSLCNSLPVPSFPPYCKNLNTVSTIIYRPPDFFILCCSLVLSFPKFFHTLVLTALLPCFSLKGFFFFF